MLNNISLAGRTTKDPEMKVLQSGKTLASFTLAVQRSKTEVDFIPCEAWEKTAESLRDYVKKGSMIAVEGSLKVDSYQTDGVWKSFTKVVVSRVHFIDLKKTEEEQPEHEEQGPSQFMTDEELARR